MISKYNDFILDKQFESILFETISLLESKEGKWISDRKMVWDYTENDDNKKESDFELKLKKLLSNLDKKQIKKYFYKFLKKIRKMSKKRRKKIIVAYSFIFLSFVSFDYLVSEKGENIQEQKELIEEFETELKEIEEIQTQYTQEIEETKEKNKSSEFDKAQAIIKKAEGGYSEDRKDRGNFVNTPYGKRFLGSNHGISAPILANYMGKLPTKEDMENLTYETALKIYKKIYWDPQNLSEFSDQNIANIIYDACVNQGISGAKKVLREAYRRNNIEITNSENPFNLDFIEKANKLDQEKLFTDIKSQREIRYKSSITYKTHGKGWISRLSKFKYNQEKNS